LDKRNSPFKLFLAGALVTTMVFAACCVVPLGGGEARANAASVQWNQVQSNTKNKLEDVFALDSNHVWAVGEKGTVLFYNGTAWSNPINVGTTSHLYAVVAFNENDVWVLGDKIKVHYNGTNWGAPVKIEETVKGACVVPVKPGGGEPGGPYQGWACTDKGNYYTYYDGDWHYQATGHKGRYDIAANCEGTAWSVGDDARIERWKGGWRTVRFGGPFRKSIRGVSTCGNQKIEYRHRVLAVGDGHMCFFTKNGIIFEKDPTGSNTQTLCAVTYPDESHAWAVGNGGTIVYSNDIPNKWAAQSWNPLKSGGLPDLYGIHALDQYNVWVVGDKGTIIQSVPPPRIVGCSVRLSPLNRVVQGKKYNVDVTGANTHFSAQSQAGFGDGIQVETNYLDSTHVTASITVDKNAKTGSRDVNVITGGETPIALSDGLTVVAAPAAPHLDGLDPNHGTVNTNITLSGKSFGHSQGLGSYVTFNGKKAHNYTSWSDGKVVVEVPTGATSGPVQVTTSAGASNTLDFTVDEPKVPAIVGCYPNSVVRGNNKLVTIKGKYTHFQNGEDGGAASVATFDPPDGITVLGTTVASSEMAVANIVVDDDAPTGARSVNVITGGETPTPLTGHFTIIPSIPNWPVLDSLSTDRGSVGDQVTLTGMSFGSTRASSFVSFNGVESMDYASWSDTSITCSVPEGATTGPVTVTTTVGTSGGILFTVGSPYIKDCDPTGLVQGHQISNFQILGDYTHFVNGESQAAVSGNGVEVSSTYVTDSTHATCNLKVASDAPAGTREVNVVTGDETPYPLKNVFTIYEAPPSPPEIYSITPGSGPVGSMAYIKGKNFGAVRGSSRVLFNGTAVTNYLYWNDHEIVVRVPMGAKSGLVEVRTPWGSSNYLHFGVAHPVFYFAEGTTRPRFDPYLCIQNPGGNAAQVKVAYMSGDGAMKEQDLTVPPTTRATVNPHDTLGEVDDAAHDFSCQVKSTNGEQVIAERPMYFNYQGIWPGGSDVMGAQAPATNFFFAEGTCRPGFIPYLTIQNPGDKEAAVNINYMKGDGTTAEQNLTVPPTTRTTVNPRDVLGEGDDTAHDFSCRVQSTEKIVAERPMYFDYQAMWPGGDDVMGAVTPARSFYFAEGTCRSGFQPYVCIENPCKSEAEVVITYMRGDGTTWEQALTVPAHSRSTVNAKDTLGWGDNPSYDFSCRVECTNNLWIVAERPMYFNYTGGQNRNWPGGSDVMGALSPADNFYFAEGTCRPGFDTYLCLQNPGIAHAQVKITYMRGDGTTVEDTQSVPANSRITLRPRDVLGTGDSPAFDFSTRVESTNGVPVVCERPIYFNYNGVWPGGHDVVGFAP
jgi:IPT/TIG domain/Photosynthesis system II assembly factor YCF48/Family of unknown function (DUF5719)